MNAILDKLTTMLSKDHEQVPALLGKIMAAAQPGAVFGEPIVLGNYTIITACEVAAGGGFGQGLGLESLPASAAHETADMEAADDQPQGLGGGSGGGGGGGSTGRPVAVIVVGPDGVRVTPVVDTTKLLLALLTTLGAIGILLGKMRRASS